VPVDNIESTPSRTDRELAAVASHVPPAVRPKLRGWLHLGSAPVALVLGLILMAITDDEPVRWALAVYTLTSVLLFGMSAIYHVITWQPKARAVLRRIDHANIFLFIAGSYTPLAVALLPRDQMVQLLVLVWFFALLGVLFQVAWVTAPRWLSVVTYIGLGWVAVFYIVPLWREGGVAVALLLLAGGLLYTLGAVVYARRKPDPDPEWFGYHEIFHAFTIAAFTVQYIAIALAVA
jgi:hemolysin III